MSNQAQRLAPYRVGALLYTPATRTGIAEKLERGAYPGLRSMVFCLEDSIRDEALAQAEASLKRTLEDVAARNLPPERLPMLFVRIRTPEHMSRVHALLGDASRLLTGYVLPKFDPANAEAYLGAIQAFNRERDGRLYAMPILESGAVAGIGGRAGALLQIKRALDDARELVLNVRVGGNDLCNLYGVRRGVGQSIYDIGVVRDVLADVVNVFAADYVVSAPVWEYFGSDPAAPWAEGLRRELALDRLNGFIGKTAIHPAQLPVIHEAMKVSRADWDDARAILGWQPEQLAVQRGSESRMNEVKCHARWAERIATLAEIYGVRED